MYATFQRCEIYVNAEILRFRPVSFQDFLFPSCLPVSSDIHLLISCKNALKV
jgi:hypothetical protein